MGHSGSTSSAPSEGGLSSGTCCDQLRHSIAPNPLAASGRILRELTLEEPIRYGVGDPVEKWLNDLLCLECTSATASSTAPAKESCPHPSACDLYVESEHAL